MSLIMEDYKPVNALEEVKKLQDLVRKLEIQNLHLRNKQIISRKRSVSPVKEVKSSGRSDRKCSDGKGSLDSEFSVEKSSLCVNKDEYFEDLEIIRVSDIEMSDDESWLYTSPKSMKQEQKSESPYKWLRQDVDDPENKQLQFAKMALLTKLNELEILSSSNTVTSQVENPAISNLRRSQKMFKTPLTAQNHDPIHVDSRTFTRSKKKQAIEFLEKLDLIDSEKTEKSYLVSQLHRKGSDVSSDSLSSCHILEDANDVQEVARMQEESLRMSSPLGTPKRSSRNSSFSSRKISTSSRGSTSDQEVSETSAFSTPNPNDSSSNECVLNSSLSIELCHQSDHSSPSDSPYGSNVSLQNAGKEKTKLGVYQRSLPNLNKDPLAVRQSKNKVQSDRCKQTQSHSKASKGRKSESSLQTVQNSNRWIKSSAAKQMSLPQSSFLSPENTEPVTIVPRSADSADLRLRSRSGLPRPSRASSASRSIARSGIPMASMLSKKRVEDTWSEGCF